MSEDMIIKARGFATACEEFSHGVAESFYRNAFQKAAEIINGLCDELSTKTELSTGKVINMTVINKEKGKGKENFPPVPPIEKRESQEKATTTTTRPRARESVGCSYVGPVWDDVLHFAKRVKIDPNYAHWWYGQMDASGWCDPDNISEPIGNWKQLLRGWWRQCGKSGDDWKQQADAKPRTDEGKDNAKVNEVFENFWSSYPAGFKVDMPKCRAKLRMAYLNAGDKEQFVKDFSDGLHRWLDCERWERGVVCNSYSWLSQERWNDHPTPSGNAEAKAIEQRKIAFVRRMEEESKRQGV